MDYKKKKNEQLGMNSGTAQHRLVKDILFSLIPDKKCFKCGKEFTREDFSIEHKIPWLDSENPKELFFDLNNIAFSHQSCNYAAARKPTKKWFSKEEKDNFYREYSRRRAANSYTPEKRRHKYLTTGH